MSVCKHSTHTTEPFIYNTMGDLLYQMKDYHELQEADKLWLDNESKAIIKYGHISLLDISKVIIKYKIDLFY
jgi:hypothetical protein